MMVVQSSGETAMTARTGGVKQGKLLAWSRRDGRLRHLAPKRLDWWGGDGVWLAAALHRNPIEPTS